MPTGTLIHSEDFNNLTFQGRDIGAYSTSDKYAVTNYYAINNFDGWIFSGNTYYALNGAGTDGAITLNEGPPGGYGFTTLTGLIPGQTYTVSFDVWGDNEPGLPWALNVFVEGISVLTVSGVDQQPGTNPGMTETASFIATGTSEVLQFLQASQTLASPIIDNVQIYSAAPSYSYTIVDYLNPYRTFLNDINNEGQVIGQYTTYGVNFLYSTGDSAFTPLSNLDNPFGPQTYAYASGINDAGDIVGVWNYLGGSSHGFLYSNGSFVSIDVPFQSVYGTTFAGSINNLDQIVGSYPYAPFLLHGFVYNAGAYTDLQFPLATTGLNIGGVGVSTGAAGINDLGEVVGNYSYIDATSGQTITHGFLFDINTSAYTPFDYVGATSTALTGINNLGDIVGYYDDLSGRHGFVDKGGVFTILDSPYVPSGIDDAGDIVGTYFDGSIPYTGAYRGFLATPLVPANHAPVASNISANANENTNIRSATLTPSFTDVDLSDTFTITTDTTGTVGLVTNNSDGTFTYDPNGQFEYLGVGETATDTLTYTVTDNLGASSTATATVTIHGENDPPVASPDDVGVQKGGTINLDAGHGVLANDTDTDIHDVLSVSAVNGSSALLGRAIKGLYGTLTLLADGSYTYVAKTSAPPGSQDVFQYSITDGHGSSSTSTLTISIQYPALVVGTAQLNGSINELPLVTTRAATDSATGTITFNIPDTANRPTATIDLTHQIVSYQDAGGHSYSLSAAQITALGTAFSISDAGSASTGKVKWGYSITDSTLDFLGANETATVTTPILIDDHHGNTVTENVVVTINGADDKPVASPDAATASRSGTASADAVHGVLVNDTDPDLHDQGHLFISAVGGDAGKVGQTVAGKFGTLTLYADGSYYYIQTASVLSDGPQDVFQYTVSDGHGGTDNSKITITVPPGERVTVSGSDLVFYNTYDSTVTRAYHDAIIAAENFLQNHFANSVTINLSFTTKPGDFVAGNLPTDFGTANTSYEVLKAHLESSASTTDDQNAITMLPVSDPSNNKSFFLTFAEEKVLGLRDPNDSQLDGTVYLSSENSYFYNGTPTAKDANKYDAEGALIHEITEEMGRLGGLGLALGPDLKGYWSTMDLFRYSADLLHPAGQHDYSGGPAYFSVDGAFSLLAPQFNDISSGGDLADWKGAVHLLDGIDAFGSGEPGQKEIVTATDLQVMDILGWTPVGAVATASMHDHFHLL